MSSAILFLVLRESSEPGVAAFVRDLIVPSARDSIQILTDADSRVVDRDIKSQITSSIIERISAYPSNPDHKLLVERDARCSIAELNTWWRSVGNAAAQKVTLQAARRIIKSCLQGWGSDWRTYARGEIQKFEGPPGNLDAWLQQFAELGSPAIGRKVAARLRVMRQGSFPGQPFSLRASDSIGARQIRCYVQDGDPGGSWLEMQAILAHACPPGTVFPVQWHGATERLIFPDTPADEFIIYEDGLWSGKEAIARLKAIAAAPPPAPVVFRFGVVTDLGLMAVRHAIRCFGLAGRVRVDAALSEFIRFLRDDIPEPLQLGLNQSPELYSASLHEHVKPYAFNIGNDWTDDEIEFCRLVGAQLVQHWLLQHGDATPSAEKVNLFALGGGRFASTLIFARSVPKVCLPLLWLNGPVVLAERQLNWMPLFIDARRVSDSNLLNAVTTGGAFA